MRSQLLVPVAVLAGGIGTGAAIAVAQVRPARPATVAAGTARVQGRFAVLGRVTEATHVPGLHRGERLSRSWTLSGEDCGASSCHRLELTVRRTPHTAVIAKLTLTRVSAGHYRFEHRSTSRQICQARHATGTYRAATGLDLVVSKRREVSGVWYATALSATALESNSGCGAVSARATATMTATVVSGVPAAVLSTGSTTTDTSTTTTQATSSTGSSSVTTISTAPSPTNPTTTLPGRPQPEVASAGDRQAAALQ